MKTCLKLVALLNSVLFNNQQHGKVVYMHTCAWIGTRGAFKYDPIPAFAASSVSPVVKSKLWGFHSRFNSATEVQRPSCAGNNGSISSRSPLQWSNSDADMIWLRWISLPLIQTNHPLGRFRRMWRSVRCYHLAILLLLLLLMLRRRRRRGLDQQQHFIWLHALTADSLIVFSAADAAAAHLSSIHGKWIWGFVLKQLQVQWMKSEWN